MRAAINVLSEYKYHIQDDRSLHVSLAQIRQQAVTMGCPDFKLAKLLTVASELGRNILKYAGSGSLSVKRIEENAKKGIEICAIDKGPGIEDIEQAMKDNVSTSGTLGLGLPGTKRLSDDFHIHSKVGEGTTVQALVWI